MFFIPSHCLHEDIIVLVLGRFLIGREKEGVESEVARLINESLELDRASRKVRRGSVGRADWSTWFDRAAFCVCACMKRGEETRNEYVCNMSEEVEEEEEDEEEDAAALSSLDKNQLCQKYQQVVSPPWTSRC